MKFECERDVDFYSLLPSYWNGMTCNEIKKLIFIVGNHEGEYSYDCLLDLIKEFNMRTKELQNICVRYYHAKERPESIEHDPPSDDTLKVAEHNEEVAEAHKNLTDVNKRLISFQLKTAGMKCEDIFKHMIKFRSEDPKIGRHRKSLKSSDHLNVELTKDNEVILQFSALDLTKREVLRDTKGEESKSKLVSMKLDALGHVKSFSMIAYDPERLDKL